MPTRSRPLWPLLTAVLIGVPVLYVASFGPAAAFLSEGYLHPVAFEVIYMPLRVIADASPTVEEWLYEYSFACIPDGNGSYSWGYPWEEAPPIP
jgi:hypothetical protein